MVRISEDLVRKRAEHNDKEIGTLEEIALHQEHIEKIEALDKWCKHLRILLLHSNIISKLENLSKLKKLEYLNLTLNNIEIIENLEGCESLTKLDLTLNFIGQIESVKSLQHNIHLKQLFLKGNPCSDYEHYRNYIIAVLPGLQELDNVLIERSDKIIAQRMYQDILPSIEEDQETYKVFRAQQRIQNAHLLSRPITQQDIDTINQSTTDNSPESRIYMSRLNQAIHEKQNGGGEKQNGNQDGGRKFFKQDGRPLNMNQANIDFRLENERDRYVLTVHVYRYLDTSLLDVDVQPNYVRVTIKNKVLQLALDDTVLTDKSYAQRSEATRHLVVTMPKESGRAKTSPKKDTPNQKSNPDQPPVSNQRE
ncbi:hypothetical protein M8J76_011630 [Diaphorina citri]|nr:hypothetical protein M8J76_011630 [Diaphorina citri]